MKSICQQIYFFKRMNPGSYSYLFGQSENLLNYAIKLSEIKTELFLNSEPK